MYPEVVEDFREAQRTHQDATGSEGGIDLEKMRQAIQKYRSVYRRLNGVTMRYLVKLETEQLTNIENIADRDDV
jgi:hypothetical protein